jgi:asparagine synthase (glutamine-hydrolysing)
VKAILGRIVSDGQWVLRESLEAMCNGMAFGGLYRPSIWQNDHMGLAVLSTQDESKSLWHTAGRIALAAQARLDNRNELMADLRSEISDQQSTISDGELILHAYLRWGEECVHHLLGDWAFAVWDISQRKLFLARDPCGISTLYYSHGPYGFAFASSIKGVLALPGVPQRLNQMALARLLAAWFNGGDDSQTFYEGIYRLPAAHLLTVVAGQVSTRRYWTPEAPPPLRLASDEEYLEAFLEVYTEAVRCRLRSPLLSEEGLGVRSAVGATLSSGLDSSSVCALAARELRSRGKRLLAFTSVPIFDTHHLPMSGRYGDETPLVELARQFMGNLDVHYVRAENFGPLAGLARGLDVHDSPSHAAGNLFWIHALLEEARRQGLGALLIGQAGNWTISWAGSVENFWPLLLSGQWQTLRSKYERLGLSPWRMVKRHFLRPIWANARRAWPSPFSFDLHPWASTPINPQWAQALDLARQMKASKKDPLTRAPTDINQVRLQLVASAGNFGATWADIGAAYGLEIRDPTVDKRLIEFCLAIPNEQYQRNGQDRALIRRAMKGLLPDEIRLNKQRGLQAADLHQRLLAELPQVQAALDKLETSALARQMLDLPKINQVLRALQHEEAGKLTQGCRTILLNGMMAGMFLERFDTHGQ